MAEVAQVDVLPLAKHRQVCACAGMSLIQRNIVGSASVSTRLLA